MPCIKKMKQTMKNQGISDEIISQFTFAEQKGNRPEPIISFIDLLDKLLTKEQVLRIMQNEGCSKGGQRDIDAKAFGKLHKEKSLFEKIELMKTADLGYIFPPTLNADGTLSISFGGHQNGVHKGKTTCSCGAIKKLKQPFSVSSTYCGCCAGHFMYHYQNALGIKLRLKQIVSSPLNTNGEKPCSFIYEIIE